jgi:hypothetical protein
MCSANAIHSGLHARASQCASRINRVWHTCNLNVKAPRRSEYVCEYARCCASRTYDTCTEGIYHAGGPDERNTSLEHHQLGFKNIVKEMGV